MVATVQSCPTERSFKHLSLAERGFIFALYCEKRSLRYIAQRLNRSVSTISREIKRGTTTQRRYDSTTYEAYFPETGQAVYEKNRRHCVFQGKFLAAASFLRFAEQQILQKHWSPDAIVGFCHTQPQWRDEVRVCTKTLYNYIDRSLLKACNIDLALKVRRQNKTPHHRKNKKVLGINIDQRPIHIDKREEFSHWEIDTVIGRASGDSAILTLIERKTRHDLLIPISRKNEISVNAALKEIIDNFGDKFATVFRSITSDNGSEFAGLDDLLSPLQCQVYFAHPYSSWERGTNERHNGLIRRFIPKKSSMSAVAPATVLHIQNWMNQLPRKILGYKTPLACFEAELFSIL